MKNFAVGMFGTVAAVGLASMASGSVIYQTGFDAPTFVPGDIHGQDGWISGTGLPAAGPAVVSGTPVVALSGTQFLGTNTADWGTGTPPDGRVRAVTVDTALSPAQINNGQVIASVYVYVGSSTGTRESAGAMRIYGNDGEYSLGEVSVLSNGDVLVTPAYDTPGGDPLGPSVVVDSGFQNSWMSIVMIADYSTHRVSYIVDEVDRTADLLLAGFDNSFSGDVSTWESADLIATRTSPISGPATGGSVIYWENYSVQLVPTPGVAALLGLGGLVAARRRRN